MWRLILETAASPAFLPVGSKYCGCMGKRGEYRIPYGCVVKIGVDIILVDIDEKKCFVKL